MRYEPIFKQFLRLRKNIQNKSKLLYFKKAKWKKFQNFLKNRSKFHKRFRIADQSQFRVSRFVSKGNSFRQAYRDKCLVYKTFKLFYGGFKKKYFKSRINPNLRDVSLDFFENRLNVVLYRAFFSSSIREASRIISHGRVLVNGSEVRNGSYVLQVNDLIAIAYDHRSQILVKKVLKNSTFWPIPPKNVLVNYKILQVLFVGSHLYGTALNGDHYLDINSVTANVRFA